MRLCEGRQLEDQTEGWVHSLTESLITVGERTCGAHKIVQWIKVLAAKSDDLNSVPVSLVGGENQLS